MVLTLHSSSFLDQAKEVLISMGLEYTILDDSTTVEVQAESSIYRPRELLKRLGTLGSIRVSSTKTPLLDNLENQHRVKVSSKIGREIVFENFAKPIWIAGPCSLDESNDLNKMADFLSKMGVAVMRGGAVKPRTSPHEFQGVGRLGYKLLADAAHGAGMLAISEALSEDDIPEASEYLDIIQIGARNMQNFALLKKLGKTQKTLMLKRNAGATLREWAAAAEHILAAGNSNVILCERGVRGLERELRYTLDLAGAAFMQRRYGLPVVIDPSHATGNKALLEACTAGAMAMGFAGVMLETHPKPIFARSDALQALLPEELSALYQRSRISH